MSGTTSKHICEQEIADDWGPEPGDPFWMLEAEDGEWLKNEHSLLGTRDPIEAIRFPTEKDAYRHPARMKPDYKWWGAKPTEHLWVSPERPACETCRELCRALDEWQRIHSMLVNEGDEVDGGRLDAAYAQTMAALAKARGQ